MGSCMGWHPKREKQLYYLQDAFSLSLQITNKKFLQILQSTDLWTGYRTVGTTYFSTNMKLFQESELVTVCLNPATHDLKSPVLQKASEQDKCRSMKIRMYIKKALWPTQQPFCHKDNDMPCHWPSLPAHRVPNRYQQFACLISLRQESNLEGRQTSQAASSESKAPVCDVTSYQVWGLISTCRQGWLNTWEVQDVSHCTPGWI